MSSRMNDRQSTNKRKNKLTHGDGLRRASDWILKKQIFANVKVHGNARWKKTGVVALVRLAIFWMWSQESSIVEAANDAINVVKRIFGFSAVNSYQSLTNALQRYDDQIRPLLWRRLQSLMEQCDENGFRIGIWLALAVDGSRVSVPRTLKNEEQFCKPDKKKTKKRKAKRKRGRHAKRRQAPTHKKKHYNPQAVGPQMWLTLIWHIGQQLPWCWKTGPSYSSERHHVLDMLQQKFPENTLFCGDAGFVGYDFWRMIADDGHHFLMRVGGNVRLLKKLGWHAREGNGIVYCWPDKAMKNKQPPLVLRLLHFQDARNGHIYLVTNVLNERQLSDAQAAKIFRQRWGIEVQFRSLKQTFGRTKLRSNTPEKATIELHWSLLALWMVQLLAHKEQTDVREPGEKTSVATILRIVRRMMQHDRDERPGRESFQKQLAAAVTDTYERKSKKKSRNYPRRKEEPATGKPKTRCATREHKLQLQKITMANAA